jgi:hypothetical protein
MYNTRLSKEVVSNPSLEKGSRVDQILPFICGLVAYKTFFNYYLFIIPQISWFWTALYNVVTLFMLVLFLPMFFTALSKLVSRKLKKMAPVIVIPLCVVINIVYVMICANDLSIISRSYYMAAAAGTNDQYGYYFSQVNTWFGNMAIVALLAIYTRSRKTIVKCVVSTMMVLVIPILILVLLHPEYLGIRQSTFESSTVTFGGGLWNIGVIGFGSVTWIGMALLKEATKAHRIIIIFSAIAFIFVGIAGISRTLILMVLFSGLYYFFKAKKNASWAAKLVLVLLAVFVFCLVEQDLIAAILDRFSGSDSVTGNIRLTLWAAYIRHFGEVFLIGAPLGSVYNYYNDVNMYGHHFLPHSAILNFLIRFGLVACIAYLSLVKNAFWSIKATQSQEKTRLAACIKAGGVAYITLAFINQTGYAEAIFYVMFGLLLALVRIENSYEES